MGDSEAGSIISFGAVAVLAVLLYKKVGSLFGTTDSGEGTAASTAAQIVSGGGTVKETVKEVIVQSTGSGSESGKFDPLSWYGVFGSEAPSWYTALVQGNKNADKTEVPSSSGVSKTYGTGDTEYDKYVNSLTDEWNKNMEANIAKNQSIKTAQAGIDTLSAGYAAAKSGQDTFEVNGTKYTQVVKAPKSGTSSSGSSSIKRQGGSGTGEDKVRIIKKV